MSGRGTRTAVWAAAALASAVVLTGCGSADRDRPFLPADGLPTAAEQDDAADEAADEGDPAEDPAAGGDNGITALPPEEIVVRAMEAVNGADSMRLSGTLDEGAGGTMDIDMLMDTRGDCTGTMGVTGQGSFELLKRGEEVWYKPDAAFWEHFAGPEAVHMEGMYLHGTIDHPSLAAVGELCALQDFLGTFDGVETIRADEIALGEPTTHLGVPVITLEEVPRRGVSRATTLLVATEGEPYLMHMAQTENGKANELSLSDFDTPVEIVEPPSRLVLEADELAGGPGSV
ncbi:hypothetical protein MTQ13_11750 [Streptomyces sp. XM4011]|uniref:hypothetical protein n=1 Tax=Streptomyces sp. XM4011 TaxID=2929780 RepID=UPI001FFBDC30|nr:hypothetical protein [Streptomyces sp. XM4011]MCK1814944.1 hypothetical protein [Streptomyces sp. XM4011]